MVGHEKGRRAGSQGAGRDRVGIAAILVPVLAVGCCAAGPAILALFGGVALGAVVGWAAGAVAILMVLVGVMLAARRHRSAALVTTSKRARR